MDPFLGEIKIFAGSFAPVNWLFCDGSVLNIAQYNALYALIGTTYGGNGSTTFAVPDLRGRLPIGLGTGPGLTPKPIGAKGGTETAGLVLPETPAHTILSKQACQQLHQLPFLLQLPILDLLLLKDKQALVM